jgi:hypothetical protein
MTEYFTYMSRTFRLGGAGILSSTSRAEICLIFTATCAVLDETSYCNQRPVIAIGHQQLMLRII